MSYPPSYGQPQGQPQNGIGLASMVLGIVALVLSFTIVVGFVCGVLAIVFGVIGRRRAQQGLATNPGQATAGLVTGIVAIVALIALALVVLVNAGSGSHFCFHVGTGPNPCATN